MSNSISGPNFSSSYQEIPEVEETKIISSKRTLKRGGLTDLEVKIQWKQSVETLSIHNIPLIIPIKLIETFIEEIARFQDNQTCEGQLKIVTIAHNLGVPPEKIFEIKSPSDLESILNGQLPNLKEQLTPQIIQNATQLTKDQSIIVHRFIRQVFTSPNFDEPAVFHKGENGLPCCVILNPNVGSIKIRSIIKGFPKSKNNQIGVGASKKVYRAREFRLHATSFNKVADLVIKENHVGFLGERDLMIELSTNPQTSTLIASIKSDCFLYPAKNDPLNDRVRATMPLYDGTLNDINAILEAVIDPKTKNIETQKLLLKVQILQQLTTKLSEFHKFGLIHRDIKSENIFFNFNGNGIEVFLADLGLTRRKNAHFQPGGTALYISPESYEGVKNNEKTDYWSLGIIAYLILFHSDDMEKVPGFYQHIDFDYSSIPIIRQEIGKLRQEDIDKDVSINLNKQQFIADQASNASIKQKFQEVLSGILQIDPSKRMNHETVIEKLNDLESTLKKTLSLYSS